MANKFQIVVSYLGGRYACFFIEKPIEFYGDLIYKIKEAVPYIRNVPNEKIRTAYKDINLGVFIAIPPDNNLILHEAFRNAYDCGAETFKRLELEVREIDSPFVAKTRREERVRCGESTTIKTQKCETTFETTTNAAEQAHLKTPSVKTRQKSQNRLFESQSEDDDEFEVTSDWKKTKVETITAEFQEIEDELLAVDAQLKELSRNVTEPPQEGQYKSIICGNCHLRGHRAEGNKNKAACKNPPCILYVSCGQRKKHPEHFEEIKKLSKRRKQLTEKLDILDKNKKHLAAFESKTISAFTTAVTGRLAKAFPDRYDTRTAAGKIKLQKDIATIRIACNNKVPAVSTNDRSLFLELLEKQQQDFDEVNSLDRIKPIVSNVYSTLGQSIGQGQSMGHGSGNVNTVNNISSPVAVKKSKKKRRRSRSSSGSSSSLSSSSSSDSDTYVRRTINRHSRTSKRK